MGGQIRAHTYKRTHTYIELRERVRERDLFFLVSFLLSYLPNPPQFLSGV